MLGHDSPTFRAAWRKCLTVRPAVPSARSCSWGCWRMRTSTRLSNGSIGSQTHSGSGLPQRSHSTRAALATSGSMILRIGRCRRDFNREAAALFHLDQLDGLPAWPLDHRGAGVAEAVHFFQDGDAFAAQLGEPSVKIRNTERDMVIELTACAHERLLALPHVRGERHVAEGHGGGGGA